MGKNAKMKCRLEKTIFFVHFGVSRVNFVGVWMKSWRSAAVFPFLGRVIQDELTDLCSTCTKNAEIIVHMDETWRGLKITG